MNSSNHIYTPAQCRLACMLAVAAGEPNIPEDFFRDLSESFGGKNYLSIGYQAIAAQYFDPNISHNQAWDKYVEVFAKEIKPTTKRKK